MVKLNVSKDLGNNSKAPDIFRAAQNDDPVEMVAAIDDGQSLNDINSRIGIGLTPIHLACIYKNTEFLKVAIECDFDPWIRDGNMRLSIDHARAQGLTEIQELLLQKLYPTNFHHNNILKIEP